MVQLNMSWRVWLFGLVTALWLLSPLHVSAAGPASAANPNDGHYWLSHVAQEFGANAADLHATMDRESGGRNVGGDWSKRYGRYLSAGPMQFYEFGLWTSMCGKQYGGLAARWNVSANMHCAAMIFGRYPAMRSAWSGWCVVHKARPGSAYCRSLARTLPK